MKGLMKRQIFFILFIILVTAGLPGLLLTSCSKGSMKGMIILTQGIEKIGDTNSYAGGSWRFIPHARLVAVDPARPDKSPRILTGDFVSACTPDISYDGRTMLFAGQRKEGEAWQIWEMNLRNSRIRQVIVSTDNCIDPVYLPGDRLAFCRITVNDSLMAGCSVFTGKLDGSGIQRVTFNPNTYFGLNVLRDGRLLAGTRQLLPEPMDPYWVVLRPDGTKADKFYKGVAHSKIFGRAWETTDGKIIFTESENHEQVVGHLVSIRYNRPLHSRVDLAPGNAGDFYAVYPWSPGVYLVSCRKPGDNRYALYTFDAESGNTGKKVFKDPEYDILDVVVVQERIRPKKLPSEVDMGVKTGLLLCQDINILGHETCKDATSKGKAAGIEILGLHTSYGKVTVEKDGSFYIKAMADTPFRIQTLDGNGRVINSPSSWIWLRPNERRGCIGCHENPELAPENKVPLAVKKNPVIVPVHITEVTEKEVDLE